METTANLTFKPYYVERIYIDANVETGVLYNRSGRRMIALTNDFLLGLHRAIERECGERTEQVLYTCGKRWGKNFGQGLDAEWTQFYETPAKGFPFAFFRALLLQEFAINGWGTLELDLTQFAQGVIVLQLAGAIMSEIMTDKTPYATDVLTAGILGGMLSHFLDHDLGCIQSHVATEPNLPSLFICTDATRIESVRSSKVHGLSHEDILTRILNTAA